MRRNHGDRVGQRQRRYRLLAQLKATYLKGRYVPGSFHKEAQCEGCGNTFPIWRDHPMRFCSRTCVGLDGNAVIVRERRRLRNKRIKAAQRQRERAFRPSRPAKVKAPKPLKPSRKCRCCAVDFVPPHGSKHRIFCSATCQKRYARKAFGRNHLQRARIYGVPYEPVDRLKVFERDGWICQICGDPTPRELMGTTAPNAPELDHRIPMAKPHCGPHSYANCQCACRRCNIRKGARLHADPKIPAISICQTAPV